MIYNLIDSGAEADALSITLFEATPGNHVLVKNNAPAFTILAATPAYLKQTGYTKEAMIGKGVFEAFPVNSDPTYRGGHELLASYNHVLEYKEPHYLPMQRYDLQNMDGSFSEKYWKVSNHPVVASNGEVVYIIHTSEDITDRVKAGEKEKEHQELVKAYQKIEESQAALVESGIKYRNLFDSMGQAYCTIEILFNEEGRCIDYRYLEINPAFERQSGLVNAVGKTIRELAPDIETYWFDFFGNVALTGKPNQITDKSNALNKWFEIYAISIGNGGSHKVGVFFTDVTERKKAEAAIKQSESNLRNVILQAPVAMTILRGPSFVIEVANDFMYELWGRGKEEVLNKSIFEGVPEVKNQGYEELLTSVYTTGKRFTAQEIPVTLPREKGIETVYINLLYEAFREPDGTISGVIAVATDVSEQVRSRLKLEAINREMQFALDAMPQMVWVTKQDGYHDVFNQQWYDYTGLTHEQTKGTGWEKVIHADDVERTWKAWSLSLDSGEPYQIEYRLKRFDGQYQWFLGRALPLRDETGSILKWFGTCTDIHDQKIAADLMEQKVEERTRELRQVNDQLKQFTYAASHDLQEPLRKISFFIDRLLRNLGPSINEDNKIITTRIQHTAGRMRSLIDDLLAYSNTSLGVTGFEEVDLNAIVQGVLDDMEATIIEKGAIVDVQHLPTVMGDHRQLRQLFQNIISNALKYGKKEVSPQLHITFNRIQGGDTEAMIPGERSDELFYQIELKDNGIGFDADDAERIFRLFQRLHGKAEYEGTGVGLAIVQQVAENHKGYVWAESAPGEGSTFKLLLPADMRLCTT